MCLGVQQSDRARLKIKGFYLRLSISDHTTRPVPVPDSLTLCYLPRINGSPLEIDGSSIRPDSPGFVTLHRVVSPGSAVFGSRERVRLSEGARFEVYVGEDKLLRGIFRKDEEDEWKMDVRCVLEREMMGVREAEVGVEVEGEKGMREKVKVVVRRESRKKYCLLEEIPEEREEGEVDESDGCYCCCSECSGNDDDEIGSDGGDEVDVEGVKWAVDVGIWVMCLGVGYLVSKASSKSLRRNFIL